MNEIDLVKQCKRGNPKAQEVLYQRYGDIMYRVVLRYVRIPTDAEDILVTAFTHVFKNIDRFEYQGDGKLGGWIRKIVVNEALQWLRRNNNFNLTEQIDDFNNETGLYQLSELEAEDIYRMITCLPAGYRTVFNLYVVEGYSHPEIAAMLAISENTSRSQLFKAKTLLQKMLSKEGFQYGT